MTATMLTPAAAAKIAGVSRSAIMRAINSKDLVARRDNRNRWQIDRSDLDTWSSSRPEQNRSVPTTDQPLTETVPASFEQLAQAKADIAALQATLEGMKIQVGQLENDRDSWKALAEKLSEPRPDFLTRLSRLLTRK
ncbi:helix-turn-helix domain-containing protein [Phaeobacter italicus]|jgi:excisionase family DNA binding protein|uniref:helix-turn-helix domain-containing protein n=1 Tax=Phaeobacter italicus TaxID=481446 RepID=UPI002FDB20EE